MITKIITVAIGAGIMFGAVFTLSSSPPIALVLAQLTYEDGMIHQQLTVQGTDVINADWAAKFERDGRAICGGGGAWPYTGGSATMTPDAWTGDDCPELQVGDVGTAVWTWTDSDGTQKSVSGVIEVTE